MYRVLGLDISLSSTGAAVIEVKNKRPKLVQSFIIKTNPKDRHGLRLHMIAERLKEAVEEFGPFDAVVRERGFSRFAASTQAIYKVHGIVDLLFRDREIIDIPPTTVKKAITGDARASKEEVEKAVRKFLRLSSQYKFESDDESDAAAVALSYLFNAKLIRGEKRNDNRHEG